MPSFIGNTFVLLPILYALNTAWCLFLNIRAAKASGIPYVIVPWYGYNTVVSILAQPLHKFLDKISPNPAPTSWRRLVGAGWLWKMRHQPFVDLGTDTFLVVSPGGIIMYTADADVMVQVTSKDKEFPKATILYRNVNIYGENIVSSEGATWRKYRKLTASSFSEKNNKLVWRETLTQTKQMLASWTDPSSHGSDRTVNTVGRDAMRLSLTVISRAGLGQEMQWGAATGHAASQADEELRGEHKMSASSALELILEKVFYIIMVPHWLLSKFTVKSSEGDAADIFLEERLPSAAMKKSYQAYDEWGWYMREMVAAKRAQLKSRTSDNRENMDLIGQFISAQQDSLESDKSSGASTLSESEIIGNLFIFTFAGHETAANSIHFTLLLLALNPEIQKQVQDDLDNILENRDPGEWEYERDFPRLYGSMLGAALNEQLRLITPVNSIPKMTGSSPQPLTIDNKQLMVPTNTMIRLCVHSVHRNPRFWPHGPPQDPTKSAFPPGNVDNDLEEFKPTRWLQTPSSTPTTSDTTTAPSQAAAAAERTSPLYTPRRGAYLPFSDGPRACPGKRFAQTEVLAALALILSQYSIELAVDAWATDEEVERMTEGQKREVWGKAREEATWIWQQKMRCIITLQIRGARVPMRVVRRGRERFRGLVGRL